IGDPPAGSVWRLLVVKAGNEINDLWWDPVSGDSFDHSRQGGWSHVIRCSRPIPTTEPTEPPADSTTTPTIPDEVSPTSIVSTTDPGASTTDPGVSTTAEVSPETLPFTGFENGTTGLLALVLVASGALALVGTRVFREETDE
ncbi:MAG: hypothetical protein O7C01_10040, partial [Actinobacteria bacterium]|nr:hypothetical protein [Actinomycetota bacterium]